MSETVASVRYARALFDLAREKEKLEETDQWLSRLTEQTGRFPKVEVLMQNPIIKESEKIAFLDKLFPKDIPILLKDFLKVLVEKKRFLILREVRNIFHSMFERRRGILEIELLSVVPFSNKTQEKLKKTLAKKLRPEKTCGDAVGLKEIRLIPKTDSSLIGGFVLRFEGKEIDCSYKTRFHEIEQQLLAQ